MLKSLKQKLSKVWQKIKDWVAGLTGWRTVGSIVYARFLAIGSFITGALAFVDWQKLIDGIQSTAGFNRNQIIGIALSVFFGAIAAEAIRRKNAKL